MLNGVAPHALQNKWFQLYCEIKEKNVIEKQNKLQLGNIQ